MLGHFLVSENTKESSLSSPLPPDGAGPACWSHGTFLMGFTRLSLGGKRVPEEASADTSHCLRTSVSQFS